MTCSYCIKPAHWVIEWVGYVGGLDPKPVPIKVWACNDHRTCQNFRECAQVHGKEVKVS